MKFLVLKTLHLAETKLWSYLANGVAGIPTTLFTLLHFQEAEGCQLLACAIFLDYSVLVKLHRWIHLILIRH